jgi:hypothetical protein
MKRGPGIGTVNYDIKSGKNKEHQEQQEINSKEQKSMNSKTLLA